MIFRAPPALSDETRAVLAEYATSVLACPPDMAPGGIHVIAAELRRYPAWKGFVLPVVGLVWPEGAVIAVQPLLRDALIQALGSDRDLTAVDMGAERRLTRAVRAVCPNAFTLGGVFRAADGTLFHDGPTPHVEQVGRDDPTAAGIRPRFDGAIFAVRGAHGRIVSWAALKEKHRSVWEIAVATEAPFRGRGYAREVVRAATRHTLAAGRIAIYIHDHDNEESAFVARDVGFVRYCGIVLAEY